MQMASRVQEQDQYLQHALGLPPSVTALSSMTGRLQLLFHPRLSLWRDSAGTNWPCFCSKFILSTPCASAPQVGLNPQNVEPMDFYHDKNCYPKPNPPDH